MPPAHRGPTGAPIDRWTAASPTAIASGFNAAMAIGPQPSIQPQSIGSNSTFKSSSADFYSDDDDDDDDEDEDDDEEPNANGAGKKPKSKAKAASGKKGSRGKDPAALQHRKEQNRAAQREFRQRKQQYIRALEARVELLSSDHDTQVDRLRFALRQLLIENNSLRVIVGSLADFIGSRSIGGCLAESGFSREELEEAISNRSEKTMTQAWQNWPGAKECEVLKQLREESNIPPEGLPESRISYPPPSKTLTALDAGPASALEVGKKFMPPETAAASTAAVATAKKRKQSASESKGSAANNDAASHVAADSPPLPPPSSGRKRKKGGELGFGGGSTQKLEQSPSTRASTNSLGMSATSPEQWSNSNQQSQSQTRPLQSDTGQQHHQRSQGEGALLAASATPTNLSQVYHDSAATMMHHTHGTHVGDVNSYGGFGGSSMNGGFDLNGLQPAESWGGGSKDQSDLSFLANLFDQQQQESVGRFNPAGAIDTTNPSLSLPMFAPSPSSHTAFGVAAGMLGGNFWMGQGGGAVGGNQSPASVGASGAAAGLMGGQIAEPTLENLAPRPATRVEPSEAAKAPPSTPITAPGFTRSGAIIAINEPPRIEDPPLRASGQVVTEAEIELGERRFNRLLKRINRARAKKGGKNFFKTEIGGGSGGGGFDRVEEKRGSSSKRDARSEKADRGGGDDDDDDDDLLDSESDPENGGSGGGGGEANAEKELEKMERFGETMMQVAYHIKNYRRNPNYRLPPLLRPTKLQKSQIHDPIIDGIPFAGLRDRLIQNPNLRGDKILCELLESSEITLDADYQMESSYSIKERFLVRHPELIDERTLEICNRARKRDGLEELSVGQLWAKNAEYKRRREERRR
ncbi:hypothetical protein IE53DRAFT_389174 [Violaceomyces palustris]|uniref:Uncharacterized protein n=1 Tax=Violaceomyces palustris TaxID=1673888 RepID=A0ACD0NS85_9BASI|nr:hypothetical protein IE53DRAFT_389174 [Violaceomyces palustris]